MAGAYSTYSGAGGDLLSEPHGNVCVPGTSERNTQHGLRHPSEKRCREREARRGRRQETEIWQMNSNWGSRLFLAALFAVVIFFWWLLIYSGGAAGRHGNGALPSVAAAASHEAQPQRAS